MGIKKAGSFKKLIRNLCEMEGKTLIGTCGDCAYGNHFDDDLFDEGMYCDMPDVSIYECDADFGCRLWEKKTDVRG